MITVHQMSCSCSVQELRFECVDGCGRVLSVDRTNGRMTVISHGDVVALHRAAGAEIDLRSPDPAGSRP